MNSDPQQCTTMYTVAVWVVRMRAHDALLAPCRRELRALGTHAHLACRDTKGRVTTSKRVVPAQAWSRHRSQVATPRRPDHVATPNNGSRHQKTKPCCDIKNYVATPPQLTCRFCIATPTVGRDSMKTNHVTTPRSVSRHQSCQTRL